MCLARKALDPAVFTWLNTKLRDSVAGIHPGERWCGLRVMAVDGSSLNLASDENVVQTFGGQRRDGRLHPMARLSGLYDVGTGMTWDAQLLPYDEGEATAAARHVEHAPAKALVLYDRGYPSFFLYALHRALNRRVCMRVPRGFSPQVDAVFANAKAACKIELIANPSARKQCRQQSIDHSPIALRAVRVVLSTGEVEVLLTDLLDPRTYPKSKFKALYHKRWSIEGDYRHIKARIQVENPTGRSALTLRQDVHARVLAKNLASAIALIAQAEIDWKRQKTTPDKRSKHPPKINFTNTLHICKFRLVAALLRACLQGINDLVAEAQRNTHCYRPGRSAPRPKTRTRSKRFPMAYKQTA